MLGTDVCELKNGSTGYGLLRRERALEKFFSLGRSDFMKLHFVSIFGLDEAYSKYQKKALSIK
jgi:hypothetical protein